MTMQPNAIEAVVGWMDAMRRGDLDDAAGWFHPNVTWKGVAYDALCRNRAEVIQMLRDSLTPLSGGSADLRARRGLRGAEAVELITAVRGHRSRGEGAGTDRGRGHRARRPTVQCFGVRNGRIVAVADYALREEALDAAGATPPGWRSRRLGFGRPSPRPGSSRV